LAGTVNRSNGAVVVDQLPPVAAMARLLLLPGHSVFAPLIAPIDGLTTVTNALCTAVPQLLESMYIMVAVPGDTPKTTPELITLATDGDRLIQVPPLTESESTPNEPKHTEVGPVIVPLRGVVCTFTE